MYTKAIIVTTNNERIHDVDVEIDGTEKGSIYTQDYEFTYRVKEVLIENLRYHVEVTKCTLGRGCRFTIKDIEGR